MMKILVVDNHPLILKLMAAFLEKEGHEVVTAEDGLSGLKALKIFTPAFIFVDLVMPNISGEKLCRIIRSMPELNETRLVVLSAIAAERQLDVRQFGADACIAKGPFKQVAAHVARVLAELGDRGTGPQPDILGLEDVHQREITKELLSSRRHFETIINHMAEGVLEVTPQGKVIFVNPIAVSLIGRPEEKLLASDFPELFADTHRERLLSLLGQTSEGPQAAPEGSPLLLNGRQITLELLPLEDETSRTIIVMFRDITERKHVEKELEIYRHHLEDLVRKRNAELLASNQKLREEMLTRQRMEHGLRQIQKMEALGNLASGVAHDFKNILQVMLGHLELAGRSLPPDHPASKNLHEIARAGERADQLIRQILTFSKAAAKQSEPVRLQQVIHDSLALFSGILSGNIEIRQEIDPDCPPVLGDASQLQQVMLNLLTNAGQAMRQKGGALEIVLQEVAAGPEAGLADGSLQNGRYARLTLSDTGPGMEPHIQDRIFEPYFTTKKPGEGTGLGLAMVHGIVKNHHGSILVQSTPGTGTTFHLFFPIPDPKE